MTLDLYEGCLYEGTLHKGRAFDTSVNDMLGPIAISDVGCLINDNESVY